MKKVFLAFALMALTISSESDNEKSAISNPSAMREDVPEEITEAVNEMGNVIIRLNENNPHNGNNDITETPAD